MIFNLKFIVDGSIDTFLEKNLSSGPGARIKKVIFDENKKNRKFDFGPGARIKKVIFDSNKKKRNSKEFFGGIRLPNYLSVKPGIGFNT
jgi:hypothetical protein